MNVFLSIAAGFARPVSELACRQIAMKIALGDNCFQPVQLLKCTAAAAAAAASAAAAAAAAGMLVCRSRLQRELWIICLLPR